MKVLVLISLVGGLLLSSCGGSSKNSANGQEVNPDLMLMDYQYFWPATESDAIEKGLTKEYYKRVKKEITETNEAIKKGVMKGADVKRIPDFQAAQ